MKRINSSSKLIEFLSGRGSGADTIVNVGTVELRFRGAVLINWTNIENITYSNECDASFSFTFLATLSKYSKKTTE